MICSKCKKDKNISEFWKRTRSKTGFNPWCKECCKISARLSNKSSSDKIKGQIRNSIVIDNKILKKDNKKICSTCKSIFELKKGTEIRCKTCESEKFAKYKSRNQEKIKLKQKEYREKNRELINKNRRERYKKDKK